MLWPLPDHPVIESILKTGYPYGYSSAANDYDENDYCEEAEDEERC